MRQKVGFMLLGAMLAAIFIVTGVAIAGGSPLWGEKLAPIKMHEVVNDGDNKRNYVIEFMMPVAGSTKLVYCPIYLNWGSVTMDCDWIGFHADR